MRIRIAILLLTLMGFIPGLSDAQNPWIDSMRKAAAGPLRQDTAAVWTLLAISDYYAFNDPDSGMLCARRALTLAEKLQNDRAIFWSIKSLHLLLYVTGNYTEELDYTLRARAIVDRLHDQYATGWSNGMLADCYISMGDYGSALSYIRVVMSKITEFFPDELFSGCSVFVDEFIGLHQPDSALVYAKKGLQLLKAQPALYSGNEGNSKNAKSQVYLQLGKAFRANAMYDSALYYYRKSIPFSEEMCLRIYILDAWNGISRVYKEQQHPDSAIKYARRVLQDRLTRSYMAARLDATNLLADVYEAENQPDSSLKYLRLAANLKDSLYSREKTAAFQNALLREQENQKEIQAATAVLKNRYLLGSLILAFTALAIIASIIVRNRRIKQLQNVRNAIADDLHDDIGSTLSSISIMNELAKARSPESLPLLASIGESTAAIQENMSDIVWTVNPGNDRFEDVLRRMNQFAAEILDAKNIQFEFNADGFQATSRLCMKQRKNLYLFFKEAINNAAKHSLASRIVVNIFKKENQVEMTIVDNGNGFDPKTCATGNGMATLKKRAEDLNARYDLCSKVNKGTSLQLLFRITNGN
jgi:two-component system, NarL family, sensor histidine kinase UhpB